MLARAELWEKVGKVVAEHVMPPDRHGRKPSEAKPERLEVWVDTRLDRIARAAEKLEEYKRINTRHVTQYVYRLDRLRAPERSATS